MKDFNLIQALARSALAGNNDAVIHQIERLAQSLAEAGDDTEAKVLLRMVQRARKVQPVTPFDLVPSEAAPGRERLGVRSALPMDRESGAPLCEVVFPGSHSQAPLLSVELNSAVARLVDEWRQQERLELAGLPVARALLLYGPPGTGKTSLALHLASVLRKPAVIARLDGLISSLLGNTARNLAALFEFCNRYDVILVLDEFDAVAKVRDDSNEVGEIKRVVNALLQSLDRRMELGITIGITNHDHLLDSAIWRRFEHQLELGLPSQEIRYEIARAYLYRHSKREGLARVIAWASRGMSGADTRTLALSLMKTIVLEGEDQAPASFALRSTMMSAGATLDPAIRNSFRLDDPQLAAELIALAGLAASDVAPIFGKDRRTVSRWQQSAIA